MEKDTGKERILEIIKQEKVKYVHIQFMDIMGISKSILIPSSEMETVLDSGVHFDGSSIVGYATIDESDMRAVPDIETFRVLPWSCNEKKTARVICDVYKSRKKRFEGDPRYILQKQVDRAKKKGWIPYMGPELEFFMFKQDEKGNPMPIPFDSGRYFDFESFDKAEEVKKTMVDNIQRLGYRVEATHHEVAGSQHEIDPRYMEALDMADGVATLKMAIKSIAQIHDLYATFMPKPIHGICGSGMHINQSLMTPEGRNLFHDLEGEWELSQEALYYIGGLLEHSREITGILASSVNSYKRLVPGYEAPVYITWANMNRSVLVRVPAARGKATRAEYRSPDPAGNPYLQFAVMLGAGLEGIEKKIDPGEPLEKVDVFKLTRKELEEMDIKALPEDMGASMEHMRKSPLVKKILGDHIFEHYIHIKTREWEDYRSQVTKWEIDNLFPIL